MEFCLTLQLMCVLAPFAIMAGLAGLTLLRHSQRSPSALWRRFQWCSLVALAALAGTSLSLSLSLPMAIGSSGVHRAGVVSVTSLSLMLAWLVQLLVTVIAAFSARYLAGEPGQRRYVAALAAVLAAVQLLLVTDHWLVFIGAWAAVGIALQHLLCFYPERPFAQLAALKKRIADRLADVLLLVACALAWREVGSASLSALWEHIARHGMSLPLHVSAVLIVLAIVLRTALLPVHGWLIQVMEAPTPVSALLHAGVVNLGGFALIRCAPLLGQSMPARSVLLVLGLSTAMLAGMVMLTRISIKVRLAWSTVAQMGYMLLECALGLYTLAALHLIGHSLYKAHTFLSASGVVRQTRLQNLRTTLPSSMPSIPSMALAPLWTISVVLLVQMLAGVEAWPWWWSSILGLAWAPLLCLPVARDDGPPRSVLLLFGLMSVLGLTLAATAAHALPLGLQDHPQHGLGLVALAGMAALYAFQTQLQARPSLLAQWRRWSYAGFYLDEAYTRLALRLWPVRWMPNDASHVCTLPAAAPLADARH